MSDGRTIAILLGALIVTFFGTMAVSIVGSECEWSLTLLRARRARKRDLLSRAAIYMAMGHSESTAKHLAESAMEAEARANSAEIEALTR